MLSSHRLNPVFINLVIVKSNDEQRDEKENNDDK